MLNIDTMYQWIVSGCVYGYYHIPDGKLIGYVATPLQEQCSGDDKDDEEDKRTAMISFAAYDFGVSVRGQLDVWMSRTCGDRAGRGLKRQELNTRNSLAN